MLYLYKPYGQVTSSMMELQRFGNRATSYMSHIINLLLHYLWSGNIGKYSALWFCIVPSFSRANTATLELNISPYCPPSRAIIYIYYTGMHVDYHLLGPWFGMNNVTVTIQFNQSYQENDYHGLLLSYLNATPPSQVELQTQERARFQLEIPYNTQVNVSIMARLCGQHRILTTIPLLYSKSILLAEML